MSLSQQIAARTQLPPRGVAAAVALFDEGATLPFVARYRKERTGGLDEVQLRAILAARTEFTALEQRRTAIVEALKSQGKLTDRLHQALQGATRKTDLEDLYAPFKQGRKTRGDQARSRGLQPLADRILRQADGHPQRDAKRFLRAGVPTVEDALKGARDIVAETLASKPEGRAWCRQQVGQHGMLRSTAKKGADVSHFRDYVDRSEPVRRIPSHRYLALCRGESEGVLRLSVVLDTDRVVREVLRRSRHRPRSPYGSELRLAAEDAVKRLMLPVAVRAVRGVLKSEADDGAIDVFQRNLEALLLAGPLGPRSVVGIDPGIRTGCKAAALSPTGDVLGHETFMLVGRKNPSTEALLRFLRRHKPDAIAVGNGTGGRETEALLRALVRDEGLPVLVVAVSEAGASVYSASELAGAELPELDLTVRGAVSIGRRLQDPLAELVKVEPASLGVGQYQHDVDANRLTARLGDVVEHCVNRVGVDVNTASPSLLTYVAGLGPRTSKAIVAHRTAKGPLSSRKELLAVAGLGAKTYEQCAGFLRIRGAANPLDDSSVHPERYALVARMARDLRTTVSALVGSERVGEVRLSAYVTEELGLPTLNDIAAELRKPGRDPREVFEAPSFREDVNSLADLSEGMVLDGVVTNVTAFGAFVDVGVHQDGLVHVSELANHFVQDPHTVVQPGKRVRVVVLDVDRRRKRVGLSIKAALSAGERP
jgi:protein Tex